MTSLYVGDTLQDIINKHLTSRDVLTLRFASGVREIFRLVFLLVVYVTKWEPG
jgi:hypothetical protein